MKKYISFAIVLSLLVCGSSISRQVSQVSAQTPLDSVLEDANDIFSRPEFQRYKNRKPSEIDNPFGEPNSSGNSGRGGSEEPGEGTGNERGDGSEGATSNEGESNGNGKDPTPEMSSREQRDSNSDSYRGGSFGDFGAGMAGLFKILGIVALVCMVGLILWLIIPALLNVDRKLKDTTQGDLLMSLTDEADGVSREQRSMEEYLDRARQMADRQEYREAVAYLLLAAMAEITARGLVTHRIGLTHRDYYRAIRRYPEQSQEYLKILKIYEPLAFGRRPAELSHYQRAFQSLEAGFRETQTIS